MKKYITPQDIRPPFARYSHGVEVSADARLVFCSGQLGIAADGSVPETTEEQARLCFANVEAVLREAGMGLEDIVRINGYGAGGEPRRPAVAVRDGLLGDPLPASTLMIVSGFADPRFTVEIECIAAR